MVIKERVLSIIYIMKVGPPGAPGLAGLPGHCGIANRVVGQQDVLGARVTGGKYTTSTLPRTHT